MKSKIIATGSYVPELIVSNHDLSLHMDTNHDWIFQRTGIVNRRYESVSNHNMALQACQACLSDIDVETVDLIVFCTYTPDNFIPTNANLIKKDLGIKKDIPCFDLNAACSGFVYGLQVADAMIRTGSYKRVLLVGSDFNSKYLNFKDRSTSILFGDGAGCVLLEASDHGIIDTVLYAQDDLEGSITMPNHSAFSSPFVEGINQSEVYFEMEGSSVFRFAIKSFSKSIKSLLKKHDMNVDDIDYVISHQANARIIESCAKVLKMDLSKFPMNLNEYGNTSAGSIPLVLDEMNRNGKLKKGMKLIVVAFGGGLSYGVSLIEW